MPENLLNNTNNGAKKWKKVVIFILLLLVPVIWGSAFIVVDDAVASGLGESTIIAGRFLLAAGVLSLFRLCLIKTKSFENFTKSDVVWGVIAGAVNFFGFYFQTLATGYTDTAKLSMITGLYVILVPLILIIKNRKMSWGALINAIVFFVGMLFLFDVKNAGGNMNSGDWLALLCSVFFAVQIIVVDRAKGVNAINFTIMQMLTMGTIGLAFTFIFDVDTFTKIDVLSALKVIAFLGCMSSAYAYCVQTFAQKTISPTLSSLILSMEALFGVVFSLIFGKVDFSASLAIGCVIMIGACVSATIMENKKNEDGEKRV